MINIRDSLNQNFGSLVKYFGGFGQWFSVGVKKANWLARLNLVGLSCFPVEPIHKLIKKSLILDKKLKLCGSVEFEVCKHFKDKTSKTYKHPSPNNWKIISIID